VKVKVGYYDTHSSTQLRGTERGKEALVTSEFKLKKMSQRGITCGLRWAWSGTRSVRKRPLNSLATYSINPNPANMENMVSS